jgi:hypothetical protein
MQAKSIKGKSSAEIKTGLQQSIADYVPMAGFLVFTTTVKEGDKIRLTLPPD